MTETARLQPEWILSPEVPESVAVAFVGGAGDPVPAAPDPDRRGSLTWREVELRSRRVARALDGSGVGPGVAWGLLANNRVEWVEMTLGNVRAGSRIVPLNWHLTA